MHNAVQPHKATRPCRLCKEKTPALNKKCLIVANPVCSKCSSELDAQFKRASIQRSKQEHTQKAGA